MHSPVKNRSTQFQDDTYVYSSREYLEISLVFVPNVSLFSFPQNFVEQCISGLPRATEFFNINYFFSTPGRKYHIRFLLKIITQM